MFFVLVSVILAISEQDVFTSLFVRSQHVYIECYHQEYFSDKASSFLRKRSKRSKNVKGVNPIHTFSVVYWSNDTPNQNAPRAP